MRVRRHALPLVATAALLPGVALAGGAELEAIALVTLEDQDTRTGGSLLGPPSSRATWYSLGGISPFAGDAMALFSTGVADTTPVPGTDLSAVGVEDDLAGVNFSLQVPSDARSLRFALRVIAPPESLDDLDSLLDSVRVEVSGDPIALDPWLRGDVTPDSLALRPDTAGLLDGTRYEGALVSGWLEAVVPVSPLSQIPILFSVQDGGESALGDLVMLLDGVRFDEAVPANVAPGVIPFVQAFGPTRLPESLPSTLLIEGQELPHGLRASLVNDDGVPVLELGAANVDWRSRERVLLSVPALESGVFGLRVSWGDGASLTWPRALRIDTPPPSIDRVRPDTSPPAGGGLAVLEGAGFFGVSSLRVGDTEVGEFSVVSSERLEFVVPPGGGGTERVLLIAAGGSIELPQGVLYATAAATDDDAPPTPSGPVVGCSASPAPAPFWPALLILVLRRRPTSRGAAR
ncbi:MAG: IPT/TIG domain-containing protein [Deltaproteobacteria bacterium]|nr:IPT/TIG domain-containing protein [Deltaproteobacteria bacterium]